MALKALLGVVIVVGTIVITIILAVNSSKNEPVEQKTNNPYYDSYDTSDECGDGAWIDGKCIYYEDIKDYEEEHGK
ncbi:hypothetical protein [Bacillus rhizoplanae]|uniref:hypothetical protein n=1 Tax=Bacillus rhizoplanae TaxID=2880966 RepID=UPI003D2323E7